MLKRSRGQRAHVVVAEGAGGVVGIGGRRAGFGGRGVDAAGSADTVTVAVAVGG